MVATLSSSVMRLAPVVVQVHAIDDHQQPGAAQNLLLHGLQPRLQLILIPGNVGHVLRQSRLLHQNRRARLVAGRKHPAHAPYQKPARQQRNQKLHMAPPRDIEISPEVEFFTFFFFKYFWHLYRPKGRVN